MIYYFKPYSVEGRLGQAYNHYCSLVPNDNDWICLLDGDTAFITDRWGHLIHNIVNNYPDVTMFTCFTNRSGNSHSRYNGVFSNNSDILYHRRIAQKIAQTNKGKITQVNTRPSGLFMLFKKSTWNENKFSENLKIFDVDIDFSGRLLKKGYKIFRIDSLYLYHYYRHLEGMKSKKHIL